MHVNPWSAVRTTGCDRDRDGVCDGVVLQQRVDCFASVLSVLSHLCVFMQLSLRSVWRCTWVAIAAPLATCGGYGRMAGGGHGVGGMRKACYGSVSGRGGVPTAHVPFVLHGARCSF